MTPRRLTPEEVETARSVFLEKFPGYYVLSSWFVPGGMSRRGKETLRLLFMKEEQNRAFNEGVYDDMAHWSSDYFTKLFTHET